MGKRMRHALQCYAHGTDGDWVAICVDLDIAIQATSLPAARECLSAAIRSYVADAMNEEPAVRDQLLARRAPWHVRVGLALRIAKYNLFESIRRRQELQASFALPCPA